MYRDDRLEFNKGSLTIKKTETAMDTGKDGKIMQKQRCSTKFDFSGTSYGVQTCGYLAGIKVEHETDPNIFTKICEKAKKASGARKPVEVVEDKFASMRSDSAFLARASLCARISGRAILSRNLKETCNADEANDSGDEDDEVKGEDHEAGEESDHEPEAVEESDHEPEAAEDGEFEAAAQAEFEAAEDREFEVTEDHEFEVAEDREFEVTEDCEFEVAEDHEFEVAEDREFEVAEDHEIEVAEDREDDGYEDEELEDYAPTEDGSQA